MQRVGTTGGNMYRALLRLSIFVAVVVGSAAAGIYAYNHMSGTSKSEHGLSVEKITEMGKLELVRITIKDVLTQTNERPIFLPDGTALFVAVGEVVVGIDLKKMKKEDLIQSDTQVAIKLPKPEILMSKINHEKSKIYSIKWGGWSTEKLVDEAYRNAELKIIDAARELGYDETCKQNARALLIPLFSELAKRKVVIEFAQ